MQLSYAENPCRKKFLRDITIGLTNIWMVNCIFLNSMLKNKIKFTFLELHRLNGSPVMESLTLTPSFWHFSFYISFSSLSGLESLELVKCLESQRRLYSACVQTLPTTSYTQSSLVCWLSPPWGKETKIQNQIVLRTKTKLHTRDTMFFC